MVITAHQWQLLLSSSIYFVTLVTGQLLLESDMTIREKWMTFGNSCSTGEPLAMYSEL